MIASRFSTSFYKCPWAATICTFAGWCLNFSCTARFGGLSGNSKMESKLYFQSDQLTMQINDKLIIDFTPADTI